MTVASLVRFFTSELMLGSQDMYLPPREAFECCRDAMPRVSIAKERRL